MTAPRLQGRVDEPCSRAADLVVVGASRRPRRRARLLASVASAIRRTPRERPPRPRSRRSDQNPRPRARAADDRAAPKAESTSRAAALPISSSSARVGARADELAFLRAWRRRFAARRASALRARAAAAATKILDLEHAQLMTRRAQGRVDEPCSRAADLVVVGASRRPRRRARLLASVASAIRRTPRERSPRPRSRRSDQNPRPRARAADDRRAQGRVDEPCSRAADLVVVGASRRPRRRARLLASVASAIRRTPRERPPRPRSRRSDQNPRPRARAADDRTHLRPSRRAVQPRCRSRRRRRESAPAPTSSPSCERGVGDSSHAARALPTPAQLPQRPKSSPRARAAVCAAPKAVSTSRAAALPNSSSSARFGARADELAFLQTWRRRFATRRASAPLARAAASATKILDLEHAQLMTVRAYGRVDEPCSRAAGLVVVGASRRPRRRARLLASVASAIRRTPRERPPRPRSRRSDQNPRPRARAADDRTRLRPSRRAAQPRCRSRRRRRESAPAPTSSPSCERGVGDSPHAARALPTPAQPPQRPKSSTSSTRSCMRRAQGRVDEPCSRAADLVVVGASRRPRRRARLLASVASAIRRTPRERSPRPRSRRSDQNPRLEHAQLYAPRPRPCRRAVQPRCRTRRRRRDSAPAPTSSPSCKRGVGDSPHAARALPSPAQPPQRPKSSTSSTRS